MRFVYGSSGTLQRQIEQGAPSDLFLSAGERHMQELLDAGRIDASLHAALVTNRLVVVVPADDADASLGSLGELADDAWRTVALGEPDTVPADEYAAEALQGAGVWDAVSGKALLMK